jgi:hypothetical protein
MFRPMIREVQFTGCQFSAPELLLEHNHTAPITTSVLPAIYESPDGDLPGCNMRPAATF